LKASFAKIAMQPKPKAETRHRATPRLSTRWGLR
jgi:hypothetical protein